MNDYGNTFLEGSSVACVTQPVAERKGLKRATRVFSAGDINSSKVFDLPAPDMTVMAQKLLTSDIEWKTNYSGT